MLRRLAAGALGVLSALTLPAVAGSSPASADDGRPGGGTDWVLERRAVLDADYLAEGPPSGAQATPNNGRTGPFPGQVIPGISGAVDNGDGTFWGLPDNGFGAKTNSADFLLRLYLMKPSWETAKGGAGAIEVVRFISLRDPDNKITFPIVNGATAERLLTGADFDVESVVPMKDGTFWIGEEFGPFLLHVDGTGKLLAAPVPFVDGKSPQNPFLAAGEAPAVRQSRGFEAVAGAPDGRYLYPIVEGQLNTDTEAKRRWIYQFDTKTGTYTGQRWGYETDLDANVIGDAAFVDGKRIWLIERDDFDGARAVTKKVYEIRLDRTDRRGFVTKSLVVDLLYIRNPNHIPARDNGGFGLGDPFSFPMQSVETVVPLKGGKLLIANDNNYPGNAARFPGTPDDTEMIVLAPGRGDGKGHGGGRDDNKPLVIGHRGASGYRPEHTLAAYELAIRSCADYIEPDVVSTKDGVLVARHENEIGGTTDIANRPEFAGRKTTKMIDGVSVTGWFTEDLTLAELRTLRAKERLPQIRPANAAYDGLFPVPTLEEVIQLAQRYRTCDGKPVGIYPETKHPTYFDSVGLSLEEPLLKLLGRYGYDRKGSPVYIQSFETGNLKELARKTKLPLVQLINCSGAPWDLQAAGSTTTYADLATRSGLAGIARYADGVGLCKDVMIPRTATGTLGSPTPVIADAHAAGLEVHGWTFRVENVFLPTDFQSSADPAGKGDLPGEIKAFLAAGMDGFFTDNPDLGAATTG
ncbi:MAG: esterase-like activity of phytase family protein [Acidimicrobiales bacterium]